MLKMLKLNSKMSQLMTHVIHSIWILQLLTTSFEIAQSQMADKVNY